jgi:hypothetical protein
MTGFVIDAEMDARTFRSQHQRLITVRSNVTPGLKPGTVRRATAKWANRDKAGAPEPARSPEDLCRQARHLRAKYGNDPVQMFQQLSRLSVVPDGTTTVHPKPADRKSTPISSNWTRTSQMGRNGMTVSSKLGKGLSMGADEAVTEHQQAIWDEDDGPRYTLVDPEYTPSAQEEAALPEAGFRTLVQMTLRQLPTVLRYSDRLSLLKEAGQRGIGRFEANLVIASVEHELGRVGNYKLAAPSKRSLWVAGGAVVLAVQSAIAVAFWKVIHG